MNIIEELEWRGMIQDIIPKTKEHFENGSVTAYVGIDPTASSLHVGHLVSIMLMKHLKKAGHRPIFLLGGATGMIGDPSGKSKERNLLDQTTINLNVESLKNQISNIINVDISEDNSPIFRNNLSWFKEMSFLDFLRDIGKYIPVGYMMNKTSVQKRIETGISFTEFTYQLVQGFDFLHLFENYNCTVQIGGSDQWGNITTGTELIRKKNGGDAFAFTCPLLTKEDGTKFGKTEDGTIWLDANLTSPYDFYQFWLNVKDEDAEKLIKIFTTFEKDAIDAIIKSHNENRGKRKIQKILAHEITKMVHGNHLANQSEKASQILFSDNVIDMLELVDENLFNNIFKNTNRVYASKESLSEDIATFLTISTENLIFPSKREARQLIKDGAVKLNQEKIDLDIDLSSIKMLRDKFLLVNKGKKKRFLIEIK